MLNRCYRAASGRKLTRIVFPKGWILMQNLAVYNKRKMRKMWRGWHKAIISENANSRVTVGMLLCSCRCGWWEDPADSEGREAERSGGFQHQDAAPHPDPAAQRQSGQPDHKEPQEEGRRHGLFNLLPVGWLWVCVWRLSRICIFKIIKFRCGDFGFVFFPSSSPHFFLLLPQTSLFSLEKRRKWPLCLDCRPTCMQCLAQAAGASAALARSSPPQGCVLGADPLSSAWPISGDEAWRYLCVCCVVSQQLGPGLLPALALHRLQTWPQLEVDPRAQRL